MSRAQTDAEAIAAVKRALHAYAARIEHIASAAEREMVDVATEVRTFSEQCRREVRRLEDVVRSAEREDQHDERLAQARRQLAIWTRRSVETNRLQAQLERDHEIFRGQQRRYNTATAPLIERGEHRMRAAREDVIRYERHHQLQGRSADRSWRPMRGSAAGSSSDIGGDAPRNALDAADFPVAGPASGKPDGMDGCFEGLGEFEVDGLPDEMTLTPLDRCSDGGRVRSIEDFDAGKATAEECMWAARILYTDLLPRMARGGDVVARLRDTDRGRGLTGNTSLEATFRGFFGEGSAIKVAQSADGTYEVINGAHRIWAARQVGVTHLPARIRRPSQ